MVGHTHQDFLTGDLTDGTEDITPHAIDLSQIKDISYERELFDFSSRYVRKVRLSYLDEHIDDLKDWKNFVRPLAGLDCLYLVNDRTVSNPIMRDYADAMNLRYVAMLRKYGILAVIATQE
ncbi:MAG: hypothetical protein K5660_05950 [Paludibacteraceae bacterium]|nr:hypothetical protein [Paludibacteraceae bacterium]